MAEMVSELGLLYHSDAWLCRAVIRFYGTALTTVRDPVLKRVRTEIVGSPDHFLRRDVEATLTLSVSNSKNWNVVLLHSGDILGSFAS
jgi:hypothetical protein